MISDQGNGGRARVLVGNEKGINVHIAIDALSCAVRGNRDLALNCPAHVIAALVG
jgi:hypothetical protein